MIGSASRLFTATIIWIAGTCALGAITLVSVEEEIAIGKQADTQLRKQVPVLRDAGVTTYVRDVGRRLALVAPGPKYPYTFAVANYREVNAFALPGGHIWLNRGVLHAATNESQVAAVLAHEIAHVAERHAANQLTQTMIARWGLGLLGAALGNSGGASSAQAAAALLANGAFLKFSRDDEREADRVGLLILRKAGWDPRGMSELFELLRQQSHRDPGAVEQFFSSHPSPQDRMAELRASSSMRSGGRRNSARFRDVKAGLRKLPPARAMPSH
jgi:beta-barrel assembly-enhancing protease